MNVRKPISTCVFNKWVHHNGYLTLARILAGDVLVLAGAGKLPERMQFVDVAMKYHVLPHPIAFGYGVILPWLELGIDLLLVLWIKSRSLRLKGKK